MPCAGRASISMQIRAVRSERMAAEVVVGNRMEADYPPNNSFVHAGHGQMAPQLAMIGAHDQYPAIASTLPTRCL